MENYLLTQVTKRIRINSGGLVADFDFQGFSKAALIVPAALNALTATFQTWDPVANAWVNIGQTQVLSTGYLVLSAAQLAAIAPCSIVRLSLSAGASADCELTVLLKT